MTPCNSRFICFIVSSNTYRGRKHSVLSPSPLLSSFSLGHHLSPSHEIAQRKEGRARRAPQPRARALRQSVTSSDRPRGWQKRRDAALSHDAAGNGGRGGCGGGIEDAVASSSTVASHGNNHLAPPLSYMHAAELRIIIIIIECVLDNDDYGS